ncbi:ATP-binding protein [Flavobacterium sp. 3HN19-14]|uniref:ATP-binding protein n=1 Tax=Flavobacterium sp. 3HN19-14 TaxID=3448133 RepID=UPI003EE1751E
MKKMIPLFFFISFCAFSQSDGQHAIDSLQKTLTHPKDKLQQSQILNELAAEYYNINPEKLNEYARKAYAIAAKEGFESEKGVAAGHIGEYHFIMGNSKESFKWYAIARGIFEKLEDRCSLGLIYMNIGNNYARSGSYPEALDNFFKALKYYEHCDEKSFSGIASCYQGIGNIYTANLSYEKAIKNYESAAAYYEKVPGHEMEIAMSMASKGLAYEHSDKNAEALAAFEAALKKMPANGNEWAKAAITSWEGVIYCKLGAYDRSIAILTQANTVIKKFGDQDMMATNYQNLGVAYLRKSSENGDRKYLPHALDYLNQSLALHKESNNHEALIKDYNILSEYYGYIKDYKKSLEAHLQYSVYKDSVFNFQNKQSLQNLNYERMIELREKEIKINKLSLESKERQKWFLLTAILFLFIIGLLFFYQSQKRKMMNGKLMELNTELDQANKVKARFFSILNHDLRSPLSNLIHFLHLKKENPGLLTAENEAIMGQKTITSAENLLESMEDLLVWSKSQMENFKPQPKNIIAQHLFDYLKLHFSGEEKIKMTFENPHNLQLFSDENYVKTIMRNLTGNAIHSLKNFDKGAIHWKAWEENGSPYLSITDNGTGGTSEEFRALYDEKEITGIKTGLGLHLIRDFAKSVDCTIEVSSGASGTTFLLKFNKR